MKGLKNMFELRGMLYFNTINQPVLLFFFVFNLMGVEDGTSPCLEQEKHMSFGVGIPPDETKLKKSSEGKQEKHQCVEMTNGSQEEVREEVEKRRIKETKPKTMEEEMTTGNKKTTEKSKEKEEQRKVVLGKVKREEERSEIHLVKQLGDDMRRVGEIHQKEDERAKEVEDTEEEKRTKTETERRVQENMGIEEKAGMKQQETPFEEKSKEYTEAHPPTAPPAGPAELPQWLPEPTELKRLSWMKDCPSWTKLSLLNKRKPGPSVRRHRRPQKAAGAPRLPPLSPQSLLQSTGVASLKEVNLIVERDADDGSITL